MWRRIAPSIDGKLFVSKKLNATKSGRSNSEAEVERGWRLSLQGALAVDGQTIGSPVYKELVGLVQVDWSNIQTARAKYFWRGLQRLESPRRNSKVGTAGLATF